MNLHNASTLLIFYFYLINVFVVRIFGYITQKGKGYKLQTLFLMNRLIVKSCCPNYRRGNQRILVFVIKPFLPIELKWTKISWF